jgi:FkbM family methyltransferase
VGQDAKLPFSVRLMQELVQAAHNYFGRENWDEVRFGSYPGGRTERILGFLNGLQRWKVAVVPRDCRRELGRIALLAPHIDGLGALYDALGDEPSRTTLAKVIAYRLMGFRRVRMPAWTPDYSRRSQQFAEGLEEKGEPPLSIGSGPALRLFSFGKIGLPFRCYQGFPRERILFQYEYAQADPPVAAHAGDTVIEGGSCWGEATLYFAHRAGQAGKVYAFEFAPENLAVLERNLGLNPPLAARVSVVRRALWDASDRPLHFKAGGPGTTIADSAPAEASVQSLTIDDFAERERLARVDFIKMDIEGAEWNALHGAEKSIRRWRPQMAIAIYHSLEDFTRIPAYLNELGAPYDFFLDHATLHAEETILFARPR